MSLNMILGYGRAEKVVRGTILIFGALAGGIIGVDIGLRIHGKPGLTCHDFGEPVCQFLEVVKDPLGVQKQKEGEKENK